MSRAIATYKSHPLTTFLLAPFQYLWVRKIKYCQQCTQLTNGKFIFQFIYGAARLWSHLIYLAFKHKPLTICHSCPCALILAHAMRTVKKRLSIGMQPLKVVHVNHLPNCLLTVFLSYFQRFVVFVWMLIEVGFAYELDPWGKQLNI